MEAFNQVPLHMRERLASLTDGETRLIGGSADTLYIPNRYKADFVEILGLFLETNCFLEIATPTTVHLVLAPGDRIQFVDHVCALPLSFIPQLNARLSGGYGKRLSTRPSYDKSGQKVSKLIPSTLFTGVM